MISLPQLCACALLSASVFLRAAPAAQGVQEDVRAPAIGSLRLDLRGNGRATAFWRTDEPTRGSITFGRDASSTRTLRDDHFAREHAIELSGLLPDQSYVYRVESTDAAGHRTRSASARFETGVAVSGTGFQVSGAMRVWFPTTLSFNGPLSDENAVGPNPFLDYRLNVELTSPSGLVGVLPGYYDGDGSGGGTGDVWRIRFAAHEPGTWSFSAHFDTGPNIAVSLDPTAGTPTSFDGTSGTFEILPRDPFAAGFYKWGKLLYVGGHHLKFFDGPYFIKGGTNSPENLFGYAGFDNTFDQGGRSVSLKNGLHHYGPHVDDWGPAASGGLGSEADPYFVSANSGVDSRGLVGALNYLASVHVNSVYMLPMNLGGDGWETCPFVGYAKNGHDKTHYDISKLAQWQEVLEHAARRGLLIQFVLSESEPANETWLDDGLFGNERKLFFREMVARFGHLPAIKWNLGEESDFSLGLVRAFAAYLRQLDVYGHPVGFHSDVLPPSGEYAAWTAVLGDPRFSTNSMQGLAYASGWAVEKWRADSSAAGRPWIVEFDEQTRALGGTNAGDLRKLMLYDVLFSGGHVEWYAGYHTLPLGGDLSIEDFRTREKMWDYTWFARNLLETSTPFWAMEPADQLVSGESSTQGGAEVLALPGRSYVIHYGEATSTGTLDLSDVRGLYRLQWYDPRTGTFVGPITTVGGGQVVAVGAPPSNPAEDWVLFVRRDGGGS